MFAVNVSSFFASEDSGIVSPSSHWEAVEISTAIIEEDLLGNVCN